MGDRFQAFIPFVSSRSGGQADGALETPAPLVERVSFERLVCSASVGYHETILDSGPKPRGTESLGYQYDTRRYLGSPTSWEYVL